MTVYVDDAFVEGDWGRWAGGGHMQADTVEELHAFATRLTLKRAWFQCKPGRPEHDHYDLTRSKRTQAILLGAADESWRDAAKRHIATIRARKDAEPARTETQDDRESPDPGYRLAVVPRVRLAARNG